MVCSSVCFVCVGVALRKESVDRNVRIMSALNGLKLSLSARRAWIEIDHSWWLRCWQLVALRKESVDRNDKSKKSKTEKRVALRKESVDRNDFLDLSNV